MDCIFATEKAETTTTTTNMSNASQVAASGCMRLQLEGDKTDEKREREKEEYDMTRYDYENKI